MVGKIWSKFNNYVNGLVCSLKDNNYFFQESVFKKSLHNTRAPYFLFFRFAQVSAKKNKFPFLSGKEKD